MNRSDDRDYAQGSFRKDNTHWFFEYDVKTAVLTVFPTTAPRRAWAMRIQLFSYPESKLVEITPCRVGQCDICRVVVPHLLRPCDDVVYADVEFKGDYVAGAALK